jgi:hypothetical protein
LALNSKQCTGPGGSEIAGKIPQKGLLAQREESVGFDHPGTRRRLWKFCGERAEILTRVRGACGHIYKRRDDRVIPGLAYDRSGKRMSHKNAGSFLQGHDAARRGRNVGKRSKGISGREGTLLYDNLRTFRVGVSFIKFENGRV